MENIGLSPKYKWTLLSITTAGVLMVSIDVAVVILAIPDMMRDLNSNLVKMVWVLMSYIFVSTVLLLALGRAADIYGRVRLYNWGFALFTVGSLLCGLCRTDWELIAFRVFQGAGGALMLVNSWALITETFPPWQRGTAMDINSMTFGIGGVIGPILGGVILEFASWKWIFFINVPIGILGTLMGYFYLYEISARPQAKRLDLMGSLAFSVSLLALLIGLTETIHTGWEAPTVYILFALFLISLSFFLWWEKRTSSPALDLKLFNNRLFNFSLLASTLQALALFAVQFLVIFFLQAVEGKSPLRAAILLLPMPLGLALMGPLGGRTSDKIGARIPASAGLVTQAAGVYILSQLSTGSSHLHIFLGLLLTGLGGGFFFSPNTSAAMSAANQAHLGVAAAALATLRNTGMVMSLALAQVVAAHAIPRDLMLQLFVGTVVHLRTPLMAAFVKGMHAALLVSVAICLAAAGVSLVRGRELRRKP